MSYLVVFIGLFLLVLYIFLVRMVVKELKDMNTPLSPPNPYPGDYTRNKERKQDIN